MPDAAAIAAACALARAKPDGCRWCGTALPERRRAWCSGRCSTRFWNNHWWKRARVAARRRDKRRCVACGATGALEVHHKVPCRGRHAVPGCEHHLDNLETLCPPCHRAR